MNDVKEAAIRAIEALPDDCTSMDILKQLYMREKLSRARFDIQAGRVHSEEEVDQRMEQWLESFGPRPV